MVRPERFELPTLWFEAKCSIQLSYGRVLTTSLTPMRPAKHQSRRWRIEATIGELGHCRLDRRGWRGVFGLGDHGDGFDDVEAGAAEELMDDRAGEATGVVFHADRFGGFIECHAADAVDVADLGKGKHGPLGGWGSIAVEDVKLGHTAILSAAGKCIGEPVGFACRVDQFLRRDQFNVTETVVVCVVTPEADPVTVTV